MADFGNVAIEFIPPMHIGRPVSIEQAMTKADEEEARPEYDFSQRVRDKYVQQLAEAGNRQHDSNQLSHQGSF